MNTEFIKTNLKNKWSIDPYDFWIPLQGKPIENTIYFETEDFENIIGYEKLNQILKEINKGNVYSFNEDREEYVYSEIIIKEYNSPDIFFTNENVDWVIYQNHEGTISFAGKELIDKIKFLWENWENNANPWE